MKKWDICGVLFEILSKETKGGKAVENTMSNYKWLHCFDDLYKRPSEAKKQIYNEQKKWFLDAGGAIVGCTGNSHTFTIYGYIPFNGEPCRVQITKMHNRIFI